MHVLSTAAINCSSCLWLLLFSLTLCAQANQRESTTEIAKGIPYIRNYPPEEYEANNQNWAIIQDRRGVMYFGNGNGLLEYDGVSWHTIPTERNTVVRSMAMDANGRIYIGAFGEIGYLEPDSISQLRFVSLATHLEEPYRTFSDVWQSFATPDGIYFVTQKYIFRWDGQKMRVWTAETTFHLGFEVNGRFLVRQPSIGLMQIKADSLVILPFGEQFAQNRIMKLLPFPQGGQDHFLICTRDNGIFVHNGISVTPFPTQADHLFKAGQIYCGTKLPNGHYAFGTLQDGVVIIDEFGKLQLHLNKANGLQDETIWYLYPDRQGGLWIGMHFGISRVEILSPHTHFGEREGLEGSTLVIQRHNDHLYAATTMGIYALDERSRSTGGTGKFHRVSGVSPQAWALEGTGSSLLAGTFEGVYEIRDLQGKVILGAYCMSLLRSQRDTNRVFVGMQKGLKAIYYSNGRWIDEGQIEGLDHEIIHGYETPEGKLWLTARYNGLNLVDFSNGYTTSPRIMHFDSTHGLTSLVKTIAFMSAKGLRFASADGFFHFDAQQQRFHSDTTLVKELPAHAMYLFEIGQDHHGNLWLVTPGVSGVAMLQADSTYVWEPKPFYRIAGIDDYYAYPDPRKDEVTWLGCVDRVIRYDGKMENHTTDEFTTLIRQVVIDGDSLLYGGANQSPSAVFTLKHGFKSFRIRYAAPSFDDESNTVYQYLLEGSDTQWSNWNKETYKDYTGMAHGRYRFLVRAKNIYQNIGETAVFQFEVLPPFYLAWWAFIIYGLLFVAILYFVWKRALTQIKKKHQVELRRLEFEKLKELDHLKSHFFANISHEFRTPLTMILGPAESLLSSRPDEEHARQYQMIRQNAQRLLSLINQLLDLSKLEAGKMKLEMRSGDMIPLLKNLVNAFESLVDTKQVRLSLKSDTYQAMMSFDREKMEQIITNLISNAIKFTPHGGEVTVEVTTTGRQKELKIDVTNTGPGIPADQLPHVFDRFYQGAEAQRTGEPGTGIGLALARELVEFHQGRISVHSEVDKTTTFSIMFPLEEESAPIVEGSREKDISIVHMQVASVAPVQPHAKEAELFAENTLLLVEDNPDMRVFVRDILARSYRIIEAVDGQDGAEKALEHIPDLIVSDVMMPRLDGLDLCQILKQDERTSHIPIILLTAKADIESRLAGLERGADDYLAKPFNRDELLIRARNLLEMRKRLWQRYQSMQPPAPAEDKDVQIEDAFLQKVRAIQEEHLSESEFEIDMLAQIIGMSRSQLFRKIKALTGQSPSIYIRSIKLHHGKELLETTEMNVSEVAYTVGFSTPAYFSDAFAEAYGMRPSQLRK